MTSLKDAVLKAADVSEKCVAWRNEKDNSIVQDWLYGAEEENDRLMPLIRALAEAVEAAIAFNKTMHGIDRTKLDDAIARLREQVEETKP